MKSGPTGLKPPTPADQQLSARHHVDSVAYNLSHAREHFAAVPQHIAGARETSGDKEAARLIREAQKVLAQMQAEIKRVARTRSAGPSPKHS